PSYEAFLDLLLPEDRPHVESEFERALQAGGSFEQENRTRQPGGAIRLLFTPGRAICENGRVVRLVGTCQDIPERHEAAERERELLREEAAREAAEALLEEKAALVTELTASREQREQQAIELETQADEMMRLMAELEQRNRQLKAANEALHAAAEVAEQARQ